MKSYELIVETLNRQDPKKPITIPEDFTEKKKLGMVMKKFIAYGKEHNYNPIGEVITHVITGKYKSKILTKDDKLMIKAIEKEVLGKTKVGERMLAIPCSNRAMNEFWEEKEADSRGLCNKFHTIMCELQFFEFVGWYSANYNGLYFKKYKKYLEEFIPSCKGWSESEFFEFKNIVREVKRKYGIVLNEEFEFEDVLYTFAHIPATWYDFKKEGFECTKINPEIAYKLYGEGLKYQFAEWFLNYCKEIKKFDENPYFDFSNRFSYNNLINSWLYDAVSKAFDNGEFDSLKNYAELKRAVFDVSMKGQKRCYNDDDFYHNNYFWRDD